MLSIDATLERLAGGATPYKAAARVVATSSITLSGLQTIDGVALQAGDRVLYAASSSVDSGLWVARAGQWERPVDFAVDKFIKLGCLVPVLAGTVNAKSLWMMTTTGAVTLGTTAMTFEKLSQVA